MSDTQRVRSGAWRSRWAAVGAAVAVTLGAGGMVAVNAASEPSSVVTIDPVRIMDTREGVGGPPVVTFASQFGPRRLQVTGEVTTTDGPQSPVPIGATGVLLNVTVVKPEAKGFLSVRPGNVNTIPPETSSLNFQAGETVPNAVQVGLPTTGEYAGQIDIAYGTNCPQDPGGDVIVPCFDSTNVLIDVVGFMLPATSGPAGPTGPAGADGADGAPGSSCTVVDNKDGTATMTCTDGTTADFPTAQGADCDPLVIKANADLANCDLSGTDLRVANLTNANLTNANLTNAAMTSSVLTGADLTNANLTNADLTGATGVPSLVGGVAYDNTVCPDGAVVTSPAVCTFT